MNVAAQRKEWPAPMSHYANAVPRAPKVLTLDEQRRVLDAAGTHRDGFRDHVLISVALGTGLREHEIAALNVGDIRDPKGHVRRRFPLRVFKRSNLDFDLQETILPDALRYKLEKLLRWKRAAEESLEDDAPLFVSRNGENERLSKRQLRRLFTRWQIAAGLERHFTFHQLRHTALTNLYRATKDILVVQRVARHKSMNTTLRYTHASDEEVLKAVRDLPC